MSSGFVTLDKVCQLVESTDTDLHQDGVYQYMDVSSIDSERKDVSPRRDVTTSPMSSRSAKIAYEGDVLVSLVHPERNAVARVTGDLDGIRVGRDICLLRPNADVLSSHYLFYFVMNPTFVTQLISQVAGTGALRVRETTVMQARLPLPSLVEQQRMVSILDRVRALQTAHGRATDLLQRLLPAALLKQTTLGDRAAHVPLSTLVSFQKGAGATTKITPGSDGFPFIQSRDLQTTFVSRTLDHVERPTDRERDEALVIVPRNTVLIGGLLSKRLPRLPVALTLVEAAIGPNVWALMPQDDHLSPMFLFAWLLATRHNVYPSLANVAFNERLTLLGALATPLPQYSRPLRLERLSRYLLGLVEHVVLRGDRLSALMAERLNQTFAPHPTQSDPGR